MQISLTGSFNIYKFLWFSLDKITQYRKFLFETIDLDNYYAVVVLDKEYSEYDYHSSVRQGYNSRHVVISHRRVDIKFTFVRLNKVCLFKSKF